jgi:hypothetical protein
MRKNQGETGSRLTQLTQTGIWGDNGAVLGVKNEIPGKLRLCWMAKPPAPSPPPALPPATQLPRTATSAPQTPQNHQAYRDMRHQAAASGRLGAPVPESFGRWLEWHPAWELRWLGFQVSGQPSVYLYHITYKPDPGQRYTLYGDPDRRTWQQWALWQRVP